jgi:predicted GIY-YIG superfamily endonuclease
MFYYVYLIKSVNNPEIKYVGYTTNIKQRLETHNSGGSIHTKHHRPWTLITCLAFNNKLTAVES